MEMITVMKMEMITVMKTGNENGNYKRNDNYNYNNIFLIIGLLRIYFRSTRSHS